MNDEKTVTTNAGTFRVRIERDDSPESPREWCNLGTMVLSHRRYSLPCEGDLTAEVDDGLSRFSVGTVARWLRAFHGAAVVLPVWGYEHGALVLRAGSRVGQFADRWDSGLAGIIYVTEDAIARGWEGHPRPTDDDLEQILQAEVETYNQWALGDVWGYTVEREVETFARNADEEYEPYGSAWEFVDSCWGFYGEDEAWAEGLAAVPADGGRE